MKGLDSWIMGFNDPNAPFNQVDWVDYHAPVLDISDWVTEEMLDDSETYKLLGEVFDDAFTMLLEKFNTRLDRKEVLMLMKSHATQLSNIAKDLYVERSGKK